MQHRPAPSLLKIETFALQAFSLARTTKNSRIHWLSFLLRSIITTFQAVRNSQEFGLMDVVGQVLDADSLG